MYIELPELAEKGYVILDRCELEIPAGGVRIARVPGLEERG